MIPWLILILAICTGMLMPLQAGVNSHLAKYLGNPFQAGFISFLGGIICITAVLFLTKTSLPKGEQLHGIPYHLFIGGLLGCLFVVITIILAPKLGATVYIGCLIAGQLTGSVILDHYGWMGFAVHPINMMRMVGICFLFTGVIIIRNF